MYRRGREQAKAKHRKYLDALNIVQGWDFWQRYMWEREWRAHDWQNIGKTPTPVQLVEFIPVFVAESRERDERIRAKRLFEARHA